MGRKAKPPFIQQTTGNPYLDFFGAAVALAIRDVEHPNVAQPHNAYSALAFLTEDPIAARLIRLADYPLPGLRELNQVLGDSQQERDDDTSRR
jgi:hypothetical protein